MARGNPYNWQETRGVEVEKWQGVPILFDAASQRFNANLGGRILIAKELAELRRKIGVRTREPVLVMEIQSIGVSYGRTVRVPDPIPVVEEVQTATGTQYREPNGELIYAARNLYHFDEGLVAEMKEIRADFERAHQLATERVEAVKARARRFDGFDEPAPLVADGRRVFAVKAGSADAIADAGARSRRGGRRRR